jgi:hypothetical protein
MQHPVNRNMERYLPQQTHQRIVLVPGDIPGVAKRLGWNITKVYGYNLGEQVDNESYHPENGSDETMADFEKGESLLEISWGDMKNN